MGQKFSIMDHGQQNNDPDYNFRVAQLQNTHKKTQNNSLPARTIHTNRATLRRRTRRFTKPQMITINPVPRTDGTLFLNEPESTRTYTPESVLVEQTPATQVLVEQTPATQVLAEPPTATRSRKKRIRWRNENSPGATLSNIRVFNTSPVQSKVERIYKGPLHKLGPLLKMLMAVIVLIAGIVMLSVGVGNMSGWIILIIIIVVAIGGGLWKRFR